MYIYDIKKSYLTQDFMTLNTMITWKLLKPLSWGKTRHFTKQVL